MKLRVTVTIEYAPNPSYYDTEDPGEMAKVDEQGFRDDPSALHAAMVDDGYRVKVEAIKE